MNQEKKSTPESLPVLPLWRKIMYALGQFGWSLASFAPGNLLTYFYMPPETGGASAFPPFIFQGAVLGVLTLLGLALGMGRIFDAVTDPLVAGLSDRSRFKMGKRKAFMAISVLPFALFSLLVFLPPEGSPGLLNTLFLFGGIFLYYWFLTMYVTPFFSWVSELSRSSRERLFLSTLISITWALGFMVGNLVYPLQTWAQSFGLDPTAAFQTVVGAFALIGFVFMLLPLIFIDERKYGHSEVVQEPVMGSLKHIFADRDFLRFTLSDLTYFVALTIATTGMVYYTTVLLELPRDFTSLISTLFFILSFVFYVPVNMVARKVGKKKVLLVGFPLFMGVYVLLFLLGWLPVDPYVQGYAVAVLLALPLSIFAILPNAVVGDLAEADYIETGSSRAAMFFGARTFMQKMGQSLGAILFPSFLLLGKSPEAPWGVRLTALAAFIFLGIGFILFSRFNEARILGILKKGGQS